VDPFEQTMNPADDRLRDKVLRIRDKAIARDLKSGDMFSEKADAKFRKATSKASAIEADHYERTGRWLFGRPYESGWFADPSGRFPERYFEQEGRSGTWTDRVRDAGRVETTDPTQ
jgi:hypothetical protein